jgi:hypothetical protein
MRVLLIGILLVTIVSSALGQTSISDVEVELNQLDRSPSLRKANIHQEIDLTRKLVTPNPSPEAVALYRYLLDMSGKTTLSGQMWAPWGLNELDYTFNNTGKNPAIAGFDYINEPENAVGNQKTIDYWNSGGIVTVMWHWGAPGVGEGYENSKATIDIDQCFILGTNAYVDYHDDLKRIGDWLQKLEDANVPVLWRPFHELDGGWFWWSKKGPEKFKLLWKDMYNYLVVERELSNLIWVLCYTGNPDEKWFPGDEYVDIAGADTYDNKTDSHLSMYNDVLGSVNGNSFPIAFHETGNLPNPEECIEDGAMWSWWMVWHTTWLTQINKTYLKSVYTSDLVITKDELPNIATVYGWDASCTPSAITASVSVDGGEYKVGNKVTVTAGSKVKFKLETVDQGTIVWSGYGTKDDGLKEQEVAIAGTGLASATFTNSCGAVYTQTFHVVTKLPNVPDPDPVLAFRDMDELFIVYPTLVKNDLNIHLNEAVMSARGHIKIIDMNGRVVHDQLVKTGNWKVDMSSLDAGVYSIYLISDVGIKVEKIIKR